MIGVERARYGLAAGRSRAGGRGFGTVEGLRRPIVLLLVAALLAGLGVVAPLGRERALAAGEFWYVATSGTPASTPGDGTGCGAPDFVGTDEVPIQAAVDDASAGDTVIICNGTYSVTTGEITVNTADLTIRGESTAGTVIDGSDAHRLFYVFDPPTTFEGLTLTNGTDQGTKNGGGAIYTEGAVTIVGVDLTSNTVADSGGAVYAEGAVTVIDSRFDDNVANSSEDTSLLCVNSVGGNGGAIAGETTVSITGSTLTDNRAETSSDLCDAINDTFGGAIHATGAVTIVSSTFEGNRADDDGGAIRALGAISISDGTFTSNDAADAGGAIRTGAAVAVTDGTFVSNTASEGGAVNGGGAVTIRGGSYRSNAATGELVLRGGGALSAGGSVAVSGAEFSSNTSNGDGGAIQADGAVSVTDGSLFFDNRANENHDALPLGEHRGGAIKSGGAVAIRDSTVRANRAKDEGIPDLAGISVATANGGGVWASGDVTVVDSTFEGNRADDDGAGVYGAASATVTNSTFEDNDAEDDGGALRIEDFLTVTNATFTLNGAGGKGGAIHANSEALLSITVFSTSLTNVTFLDNAAGGDFGSVYWDDKFFVKDTIFANGACRSGLQIWPFPPIREVVASGKNLVTGASGCPGTGTTLSSLKLQPLGDNGGPTETIALTDGSSAVDASGTSCFVPTDQRGSDRPFGRRCDVGAFELSYGTSISLATTSGGVDIVAGAPAIVAPAPVSIVTTITGFENAGGGQLVDPTGGTVSFHYCFDPEAAPTECTSGTWVDVTTGVAMVNGTTGDGIATATLADWTARTGPSGSGWYLFAADFSPTSGPYAALAATTDTNGGLVRVRPPVYVVAATHLGSPASCENTPYGFIQDAVDAAADGGTVHVCAGTHDLTAGVAVGKNLTIEGDGSTNTVVDGVGLYRLFDATSFTLAFEDIALANGAGDPDGGAVRAGDVTLTRVRATDNVASVRGGAIHATGDVEISASILSGNSTLSTTSGDGGGAIYAEFTVTLDETLLADNTSGADGGAILAGTNVYVTASSFARNSATSGDGGAIRALGTVDAENATFYANSATTGDGGAIQATSDVYVTFVTFKDDTSGSGSGVTGGTLAAANTIFAGGSCDVGDDSTSGANFRLDASCPGTTVTTGDLLLGDFDDHGGPTPTVSLDTDSVAVDPSTGSGGETTCDPSVDQRGESRPSGLVCDAGAYEAELTLVTIGYNGPYFVNSSTTAASLSLAAALTPADEPCTVTFDVAGEIWTTSGPTGDTTTYSASATSGSDGTASVTLANVRLGVYTVTVGVDRPCTAIPDEGTLTVSPGTVPKGTVGAGTYRLASTDGTGTWRKNSFGHILSVTSSYSKRTGLTTTTTKGQLLWLSTADNSAGGNGWRLKATISSVTTGGTSPWQTVACPAWVGTSLSKRVCGRFSGTGLLQQRNVSGGWVAAPYGSSGVVSYTVTVYDGGTLTSCKGKVCRTTELADAFGLTIVGVPTPASSFDPLPQVFEPIRLKSGSIRNF